MQKTINAILLRKMILSGSKMLEINRVAVDALNVFPVPDGDTGTNMSLTIQSAVKEVNACKTNNMSDIADAVARGALRGARGNSGVILSQIFRGLFQVMKEMDQVETKDFAKAMKVATEIAYGAVSKPKEGTILTVARLMSEFATANASKMKDFEVFLPAVIQAGEDALATTPELLPVLKKAGVVDAGGKGLLFVYKGMLKAMMGEEVEGSAQQEEEADAVEMATDAELADYASLDEIEFGYCTEFFIINLYKKTTLADIDKLREKLMAIGDSVIVIGDLEMVKVHVHTNTPGVALSHALELGELDRLKIENMLEQYRQLLAKVEAEKKEQGMLAISAGAGLSDIFKSLNVDRVIEGGQTMNPSADDIASAVQRVNAEHVFVFPNNKNIILAAEQAKALVDNRRIHVVPTKNIPQGFAAALAFDPDADVEENVFNLLHAIDNVTAGQVTTAVRDANIDGHELKTGDIIGLDNKKILTKGDSVAEVTLALIEKLRTDDHEIITLYSGQDVDQADAEALLDKVAEAYPDITLLPALANIFETSIDLLVGMDTIRAEETRYNIHQKAVLEQQKGNYDAAEKIYRDALLIYPNKPGMILGLAGTLALKGCTDEAIELMERGLPISANEKQKSTMRAVLCFLYLKSGYEYKANRLASELPHIRETREMIQPLITQGLTESEINEHIKNILLGDNKSGM